MLSDFIGCHVLVRPEDKQKILEAVDPLKRIQLLITIMYEEQDLLAAELDIHKKVQEKLNKNQREYFLREQLKVIRSELGDDTASETDEYLERSRRRVCRKRLRRSSRRKFLGCQRTRSVQPRARCSETGSTPVLEFP